MLNLGKSLLVIGLIGLVFSFLMETSVPTSSGRSVHNIGLLNLQQNALMLSAVLAVIGAILSISGRSASEAKKDSRRNATNDGEWTIKCPHCAETIKAKAKICRYCKGSILELPQIVSNKSCKHAEKDGALSINIVGNDRIGWALSIIAADETATEWEERFRTEDEALAEAKQEISSNGVASFLGATEEAAPLKSKS